MAVKIKSMEMPKTCSDCPFYDEETFLEPWCICTSITYVGINFDYEFDRMDSCPLEEIPDGEDD